MCHRIGEYISLELFCYVNLASSCSLIACIIVVLIMFLSVCSILTVLLNEFFIVVTYRYLNMKIKEGDAHHITCPGYDCCMLVPVEIIENVVSRDMARRYLQFDIKVKKNFD